MRPASLFRFNLRTLMFAMFVGTLAAWWAAPSVEWIWRHTPPRYDPEIDRWYREFIENHTRQMYGPSTPYGRHLSPETRHYARIVAAIVGVPLSITVFAYVMRRRDQRRRELESIPPS